VHLDPLGTVEGLKDFIDQQTRGDVAVAHQNVNGIIGASHGDYCPPRTWIDWWFKKGDTMICFCLQSVAFPVTEPSDEERAEHQKILTSLRFIPDDLHAKIPAPT